MNKIKKIIFIVIVLLIILLILLYIIVNNKRGEKKENEPQNTQNQEIVEKISEGDFVASSEYIEEKNPTDYYTVKGYIYNFFKEMNLINSSNTRKIMDVLDAEYIKSKSLTEQNLSDDLSKFKNVSYTINNIYEYSPNEDLKTYCIIGTVSPNIDGKSTFTTFFNIDYKTGAYNIFLENTSKTYVNTNNIILNDNNKFESTAVNDYTIVSKYLELYINAINENKSYDMLDENYKKARFSSIDNYSKFIYDNKDSIMQGKVEKYKTNIKTDGTREYIVITTNNRYFIVEAKSVATFGIILDSYTIPLTETTTKYSSATDEQKACMCLEQVKEMLNNKDYKTIYNHLNSTYKNNNFETQDKFTSYMKEKFYDINNFKYESYQVSNNSYIINVKVSDDTDESKNFTMSFVVKLADSIDKFEMSFEK